MCKYVKKVVLITFIFGLGFIVSSLFNKSNNIYEEQEQKQIKKHVDTISMMLETEANSGNYEMTTRESWPTEGYVFNSELSVCEHGSELSWDDTKKTVLMSGNISDKCYVYFDVYMAPVLADYVISQYNGVQGNNNIYHHDGTLENGINDGSYRYAGSSETTNNYVCFGTNTSPCPEDNLYRIIGVFGDQVKLIKYDYAASNLLGSEGSTTKGIYVWSSLSSCPNDTTAYIKNDNVIRLSNTSIIGAASIDGGCNEWKYSTLNTVNLNINYLNNIGISWANMIGDTTWKVSGYIKQEVTASEMYTGEVTNATKTYGPSDGTSKIGLMYISDYGFAAGPSAWARMLSYNSGNGYESSAVTTINWLYVGNSEWFLSPLSSTSGGVFYLNSATVGTTDAKLEMLVRPVFYLKSSVIYKGGSGTQSDPIRIN